MGVVLTNSDELKTIADAIRAKSGTEDLIEYPDGMVEAIENIAFDCTATAGDILSPKTAYVDNSAVTGTIPSKGAATYNVSANDQEIAAGQYLSGKQTIRGVTTENISAGNIKSGVNVKVGDSGSAGRLKDITGTFTSSSTVSSGQQAATADKIRAGYSAWVNGSEVQGSIPLKAQETYNTKSTDQTIQAEQYLGGTQTIRAVKTENISSANIKHNVVVTVGDEDNPTRIKNVTGTFTSDGDIVAGNVLSGKIGYAKGEQITGTISSKAAETYNTSSSDRTISAIQYLSGTQTIKAVVTENISEGNVKKGVNVKVGDSNSAGRIVDVTGTFTGDANAEAGHILYGKTAYVGGNKVTGNIPSLGATTYDVSTSDRTIAAGQYLSGAQTIRKITTSGNISAGNVKKGVNIQVGDAASSTRIVNVTGTCTGFSMMDSTQVPIIFRCNHSWGGWYHQGQSSSRAAESTVGYYSIYWYTTSDYKDFVVPTKITFTIFTGRDQNNTTQLTLNPNTWYTFKGVTSTGYDVFDLYQGSTLLTRFFKIVSWTYV